MARIYSSRVLIDPSLLSTLGTATENRIRMENERRRNMIAPFLNTLSKAGSEIDNYRARKAEEEKQAKRYSDIAFQSSQEQMSDPMYRAALDEYSRTGSAQPITSYMLSRETAEANRLERERAAAEKEELERKEFELKKAQALPQFYKAISDFNAALDKQDYELAAQYQAQAEAFNKEYQFDNADLEAIKDAKRKSAEARAEQAAKEAEAKKAEEAKKKAEEAAEIDRQFRVTQFLATLPNTFANDDAKKAAIKMILDNPDMTKQEKTDEMKRIVAIETGTGAAKKAVQGAVAGAAGKKAEKKIEENEAKKKLADKARAKIANGKGDFLTSKEQAALDEGY